MKRSSFLKLLTIGGIGILTLPILKIIKPNHINDIPIDNLECYYDFTDETCAIRDWKGKLIGWKDKSGNNNHMWGINDYQFNSNIEAVIIAKKPDEKIYKFLEDNFIES